MYCPFCGYELPNEAKFCQRCGKLLPDYNNTDSNSKSQDTCEEGHLSDVPPINSSNIRDKPSEIQPLININETSQPNEENIQIEASIKSQTSVSKDDGVLSQIDEKLDNISGSKKAIIAVGIILLIIICVLPFLSTGDDVSPAKIEKASVYVSSNPSGADVYIGGKYQGRTPLTLSLMPNTGYMLVIKKDGYEQWARSVTPDAGSHQTAVFASLTPVSVYSPTYTPSQTPTYTPTYQTSDTIDKQYVWDYGGYTWTTDIPISKSSYLKYKNLDRKEYNFWEYVSDSENRALVGDIADSIVEAGLDCGFSKDTCVRIAVSFVQSIPYKTDRDSTGMDEYYKYPIETLVDGCGDCEDSAILTAAIVKEMGYGVVLLLFEDHMAVGVKGDDSIYGTYWTYNGERYYYLETTYENWEIGEIPDGYKNMRATVIPFL